ncbi:MAG: TIGR01621 family pseudouridine synthase [Ketobacteraceae bacterium]|nr:TIGR01621 family pseudouridine synthase [Ketobacteraceae bacterium]
MTSNEPPPVTAGFQLIARTPDFVVIHKAPGIGFHREGNDPGLFDSVKHALELDPLFPVHRLDKVTSGLMLLARTPQAAQTFGKLFQQHKVDKYYLALARGKPAKKQGTIKGDMEKARRGAWKLTRSMNNPAVTHFRSYGTQSGVRVFLLKPASGKTHQIRVALKSLGTPIIGDRLYSEASPSDRVYLHAFALRFRFAGELFQYLQPPEQGELFQSPDIAALIRDQLTPPWQVKFPGEK